MRRLVEEGGEVVFTDWNAELGHALAEELGDAVHFVTADMSKEDDCQGAVEVANLFCTNRDH